MGAASDLSYEHAIQRSAAALACSLFTRHQRRVYCHCLYRLRSQYDAEDALQQTFVNALQALQAGVWPRNETAWLLQIAQNVCLERRRNAGRRARLETTTSPDTLDHIAAAPESSTRDEASHIRVALGRLEPRQREALLLREWRGLSYKEMATVLQLSQSAVEALLFRARRSLGRALEDGRRVRSGFNLGGLIANLRAFLSGGAAKTAAIVACCGATIVSAPLLEPAITHGLRPSGETTRAQPASPVSATNMAAASGNAQTRGAASTIDRSPRLGSEALSGATGTGSHAAPPGTVGAGSGGAAADSDPAAAADATPGSSTAGAGAVPGGPSNPGASLHPPADEPVSADTAAGEEATSIDVAVGGSTGVGADVNANTSGPDTGAAATVSGPDGTSASASVDASGPQTSASASAGAPGDASASVTASSSETSVTADAPGVGVSTSVTLPLP
jgi:RNA polymerase sigma-70 factor (ECF subfamily)